MACSSSWDMISTISVILSMLFLIIWIIDLHFLRFICIIMGSLLARLQQSMLPMILGQNILHMIHVGDEYLSFLPCGIMLSVQTLLILMAWLLYLKYNTVDKTSCLRFCTNIIRIIRIIELV